MGAWWAGPAGSSPFAVETPSRSTMQVSEPDPRASRNRHAASRRKGRKKRDRTIFPPQVLRTLLAFDGETVRPVGTVRPILVALPTFGAVGSFRARLVADDLVSMRGAMYCGPVGLASISSHLIFWSLHRTALHRTLPARLYHSSSTAARQQSGVVVQCDGAELQHSPRVHRIDQQCVPQQCPWVLPANREKKKRAKQNKQPFD